MLFNMENVKNGILSDPTQVFNSQLTVPIRGSRKMAARFPQIRSSEFASIWRVDSRVFDQFLFAAGIGFPPRTVPQIGMSFRFTGSTSKGSSSRTVKSASFPGSMLPMLRSSFNVYAASKVTA